MSLPPPKRKLPPVKNSKLHIQLNRMFDDEDELKAFIETHHKGAHIVKTWIVTQIACIIEI